MSSSRLPLAPDPDKWIETRPKSQPVQRPLVDLKFRAHAGIATPPSSTQRKRGPPASNLSSSQTATTAKKRRTSVPDVTPTAQNRGILSYLTPPTTDGVKGKAKAKEPAERVQRPLDAGDATSSKSKSVASPQRPSSSRMTTTPPPPELQFTQVPDDVFERHKRLCGQDSARKRKVVSPWRGVWEPIDEEAEQRQREEDRAERDRERAAAAAKRDEDKERKRLRVDVREDISRGAVARVASTKARRVLGETRSLVHLSSEGSSERSSSPSMERPALGAKNPNTLRKYSSETTGWRETKSTAAKLAPLPVAQRRSPPRARQLSSSPVAITTPPKRKSPHHKVTPPKSTKSSTPSRYGEQQETLFVFPLPAPPKRPVFEPIQPKADEWEAVDMEPETLMTWSLGGARRPAADPPSSGGPKPAAAFVPDDDDSSSIAPSIPSQDFPKLLESLEDTPRKGVIPHKSSPLRSEPEVTPHKSSPLRLEREVTAPPPAKQPRPPSPIYVESDSDTPRRPSQQSVVELPSSIPPPAKQPRRKSPQYLAFCSPALERNGFQPSSPSPSPSPIRASKSPKKLVRLADTSRRRAHQLFSSLSQPSGSPPSAPQAKARSSRSARTTPARASRPTRKASTSQSKLESFGYFPANSKSKPDFDTAFSDEEDLAFSPSSQEVVEPKRSSATPRPSSRTPGKRLQPVPEAPPHPSLRASGIAELKRREDEAMARHLAQQRTPRGSSTPKRKTSSSLRTSTSPASPLWTPPRPSSFTSGRDSDSTAFSSSSLAGEDAPRISESTRQWWDRLGESDGEGLLP
ncbi:uncharacterized protein LOC62_03G004228 [Vanrija pseudolonga]|uniref:Uncharacterized protein n=1 Tax=Vanrija pseudolonga TaxID=143232 RepID=A0AAF1BH64_9TREE|nr:hypothetical protein LOC62_03G004228 [Vanrija pseudolonga]